MHGDGIYLVGKEGEIVSKIEGLKGKEFHLKLLLQIEEMSQYPFTKLVVEHGLSEKEYEQTIELVKGLYYTYLEELGEGYIHQEHLLFHFAGMLNYKLPVEKTFIAMYEEQIYPGLMAKFIEWTTYKR